MFGFNAAASGGLLNVQSFITPGSTTYTPTPGTVRRFVILGGATGGGASAGGDNGTGGGTTSYGAHLSCTGGAFGDLGTIHMDGVRAAAPGTPTGHTGFLGFRPGGFGGAGYDGGGQWRHGQHGGGAPVVTKQITGLATSETVTIGAAGTAASVATQEGMNGLAGFCTVLEFGG